MTTTRLTFGFAVLAAAGAWTMAGSAASPKFLNDDPIRVQPDTRNALSRDQRRASCAKIIRL